MESLHRAEHGLVVIDVEGVLLPRKAVLLLRLAGRMGLAWLLKNAIRGLAYELRLRKLEEVVRSFYADLRGIRLADIVACYDLRKVEERLYELRALSELGYRLLLVGSGAPQQVVEEMARKARAEAGYGVEVLLDSEGRILGVGDLTCAEEGGKVRLVRRHVRRGEGVIVVADDWNNLQLREIGSVLIGFNPDSMVAAKADVIVEGSSLKPVIEVLARGAKPRRDMCRVMLRKMIHIAGALLAPLCTFSPGMVQVLIAFAALLYAVAEGLRILGVNVPLITSVIRAAARGRELEGFALSPLAYAAGMMIAAMMPPPLSTLGIITLAVGDGVAGLVNSLISGHPYPHNRAKKVEGTLAGFAAATALSLLVAEPPLALVATAAGMAAEALVTVEDDVLVVLAALISAFLVGA
ncbi:MAG: hypothetical protein DRK00_03660 [Thermoprotei archaeon]|nr:MAG: hypothetical protein DRK00_03660 [Thermoprotei archaeon]